jgi:hypothetical protein
VETEAEGMIHAGRGIAPLVGVEYELAVLIGDRVTVVADSQRTDLIELDGPSTTRGPPRYRRRLTLAWRSGALVSHGVADSPAFTTRIFDLFDASNRGRLGVSLEAYRSGLVCPYAERE